MAGCRPGKSPGGPGVAMAQAKQQIDIGGPWADAVQRRQRIVRGVGLLVRQCLKIKALRGDFARQTLQGLELRRRQSEPAETLGTDTAQRVMMKRVERGREAGPD